ncbi:hypothetical protein B0H11DRAFT_2227238 [Mycena galericulata]|nr:hypothetical protein B0H11DRAFT_2227238 [Mycena galericulata]
MAGSKPCTGRPPKRAKHNISGLRNQGSRQSSSSAAPTRNPSPAESSDDFGDFGDSGDSEDMNLLEMDSLMYLEVDSDHDDNDNEADWDEVADEEFQERLLEMIVKMEEDRRDAGDDDWIPTRQAAEAKRRKHEGRPTEYMKGPDTASKSKRTQQRYAKSNRGQKTLDSFFLQPGTSQPVDAESEEMESPPPTQVIPHTRSASVPSAPSDDHSESPPLIVVDNSDEEEDDDPNEWDTVLDDMVDAQVPGAAPTTTDSGSSSPPQGTLYSSTSTLFEISPISLAYESAPVDVFISTDSGNVWVDCFFRVLKMAAFLAIVYILVEE